jgi:hypothetical protein
VSPYFASQLLSIALRDLVHESPEARAMIHLDSMAEFVEQNRVDQMGRKEKQVEREVDVASGIAATPASLG